jgi:hypothetical protein
VIKAWGASEWEPAQTDVKTTRHWKELRCCSLRSWSKQGVLQIGSLRWQTPRQRVTQMNYAIAAWEVDQSKGCLGMGACAERCQGNASLKWIRCCSLRSWSKQEVLQNKSLRRQTLRQRVSQINYAAAAWEVDQSKKCFKIRACAHRRQGNASLKLIRCCSLGSWSKQGMSRYGSLRRQTSRQRVTQINYAAAAWEIDQSKKCFKIRACAHRRQGNASHK